MAEWLQHYLPAIPPEFGEGLACWVARMKTRSAEHNPPFYWLGRALDIVAEHGAVEVVRARLEYAHGAGACDGGERDDRAQRVLSEACAFGWVSTHLGAPVIEPAALDTPIEAGRIRLAVPSHNIHVLPARLRRTPREDEMAANVAEEAQAAAALLPAAGGRLLYLDTFYGRQYPSSVGYDLDLTEPVVAALRRYCGEAHVGHVFTRPFQWGNPVVTHY